MEAIYQRARPSTFAEVVGQDHVKEVLAAALRSGRTGHAYLFSGPRGVGKTTSARLLAMALNCEAEDAATRPCGRCEACTSIRTGRHPDVIELDAASNNSVEDVRELRERVRLASLRGGTRVWILDEAHMLSTAAANALLKTLEEPPPGLVFVLATTEPERLPPTVLSRCQHFRFRRLSVPEIAGKLAGLCAAAGVEADDGALELVARAAEGAMRDAESLLERLLADGGPIRREAAEAALGLPPRERLEALASALADDDLAALLGGATDLYRDGFSPRTVAEQLARALRDAVVADATGGDGFRVDLPRDALLTTLHQFDDELARFVRHDDLYALEATLIKAANAARGRTPAAVRAADGAHASSADASTDTGSPTRAPASRARPAGAGPGARREPPPAFDPNARPAASTRAPDRPDARPDGAQAGPKPAARGDASSAAREPDARERVEADHAGPASGDASHDASDLGAPAAPTVASTVAPAAEPSAGGRAAAAAAASDAAPASGPKRSLSWHQVKTKAPVQLKAFLQPADDEVDGDVLTLRYGERHRFHFGQLKSRQDELMALIEEVGGPGWSLVVEGPDETLRKKA